MHGALKLLPCKGPERNVPVYKVVPTFESVDEVLLKYVTIQMKAINSNT